MTQLSLGTSPSSEPDLFGGVLDLSVHMQKMERHAQAAHAHPPAHTEEKTGDAFKTISETAEMLGLPTHVLRFWESKFPQIKPLKLKGGRRYYRPQDIEALSSIKHLLYKEGYTIRGARKALSQVRKPAAARKPQDAAMVADNTKKTKGKPLPRVEDTPLFMSAEKPRPATATTEAKPAPVTAKPAAFPAFAMAAAPTPAMPGGGNALVSTLVAMASPGAGAPASANVAFGRKPAAPASPPAKSEAPKLPPLEKPPVMDGERARRIELAAIQAELLALKRAVSELSV